MKKIFNFLLLASLLLTSCDGAQGPKGEQGDRGEQGIAGEKGDAGQDGTSILTGCGSPDELSGSVGDSYIDLENWNFYFRTDDEWVLKGNIKGKTGNDGVSVLSALIDDDGNLIISFSNGSNINVGKIVNNQEHTVNFYFDDTLVHSDTVLHGEKIHNPDIENSVIYGWYIDKALTKEWISYGYSVTEDMNLYANFTLNPISKLFNSSTSYEIDESGYAEFSQDSVSMCISKALETNSFIELEPRGIAFNKDEIGLIDHLVINIDSTSFESAKIYYGDSPLCFTHNEELVAGENVIDLDNFEYFTIQNQGSSALTFESIEVVYRQKTKHSEIKNLPVITIDTNDVEITSKEEYVNCTVSTSGKGKDTNNLSGKIKLRGNTTFNKPKKPYRIKLDKKNSLFGYEKAKNWVLLADYLDASKMHNYTALTFSKLLNGEDVFSASPLHVKVLLNGVDLGLYVFCEHIEAKSGRLDIEQDNIWEKSFDEINFYVERDESTVGDPTEVEGVTFFNIELENYTEESYTFALKYPEKEDFIETKSDGTKDDHEEEFYSFFNNLKNYYQSICDKFIECKNSDYTSHYDELGEIVDIDSLVKYAVVDQLMVERDHHAKSFKMYRQNGGLLKFGPNWDYDLCVAFLPASSLYVIDPFGTGDVHGETLVMSEEWSLIVLKNSAGRQIFKQVWNGFNNDMVSEFLNGELLEMNLISRDAINDCAKWMDSKFHVLFDNQLYLFEFLVYRFNYLKSHI